MTKLTRCTMFGIVYTTVRGKQAIVINIIIERILRLLAYRTISLTITSKVILWMDTLREIGVTGLTSFEIAACHRLRVNPNNNKPTNVIVRFINRKRAYECLDKFVYIKEEYPQFYRNLHIFENLCPISRKIFNISRKLMFQKK